tara:strand:- start:435 stop:1328 length:894 start_codon:yes stop_codon:yes gene_type:complete
MAEAGQNQNTTVGEFITTEFDSFSNQTISRYNVVNSFNLSGKAFYIMNIERMQSAGATEDDEPFDGIRFIVSAQSESGGHQKALDDWDAIIMNRITFNCDQDNISVEESWRNTPELIDDYPNIDHSLYYSFNTCLFIMEEKQLKKIIKSKQFDVRLETNFTHIDLDDDEEENLLNSLKAFYHEVYEKETLANEIDGVMEGERKRIEERKEIEAQSAAGGCFIATVVYENDNHLDLIVLRSFRDNFLRNYKFGRDFIKSYYSFGPKLAINISKSDVLKSLFKPLVIIGVKIIKAFRIG